MATISFDFDSTICGPEDYCDFMVSLVRNHLRLGDTVFVLTARMEKREDRKWYEEFHPTRIPVKSHLQRHDLDLRVVYTNHDPKGPIAKRLGVDVHYDNDPAEIASCRECSVLGVPVGYGHDEVLGVSLVERRPGKVWLTADWHLGQKPFSLLRRPHKDADEMLGDFVEKHNALVSPEDTVIVVGDALHKDADLKTLASIALFNGQKTLVRGNHDQGFSDEQFAPYFGRIVPHGEGLELEVAGNPCYVTHYPALGLRDRFNLVGHAHAAWKVQLNALNVGVDTNHFRPYDFAEIASLIGDIKGHYDDDIFAAYYPHNAQFQGRRGVTGNYFLKGYEGT